VNLLEEKKIKILYIAPEQLNGEFAKEIVKNNTVDLVCIDEAHCVSEWSHNFRTTYLKIADLIKNKLSPKKVLALTATATTKT